MNSVQTAFFRSAQRHPSFIQSQLITRAVHEKLAEAEAVKRSEEDHRILLFGDTAVEMAQKHHFGQPSDWDRQLSETLIGDHLEQGVEVLTKLRQNFDAKMLADSAIQKSGYPIGKCRLIADCLQKAVESCINDGKELPSGKSPIELEQWKRKKNYLTTYVDWGNHDNESAQNIILAGKYVIDVGGRTVPGSTSPLVEIYPIGTPGGVRPFETIEEQVRVLERYWKGTVYYPNPYPELALTYPVASVENDKVTLDHHFERMATRNLIVGDGDLFEKYLATAVGSRWMPQNLIEKLPDIEVHPGHVSKAEFRRKKFIREHRDVKRRWRNLTTFEWMNIRVVFSSAIDKARLIDDA